MGFLAKALAPKPMSQNANMKLVNGIYTPQAEQGAGATNYLSALLTGEGDTEAANAGLDAYRQQSGYEDSLRRMSQSVVGGGAASGLLRSGSTAQALNRQGAEINRQNYDNYLSQLAGLSGIGNQAGGLLVNAGQGDPRAMRTSGLGTAVGIGGKLWGGIFSDRRLKEDIVPLGHYDNGLPKYEFRYKGQPDKWIGTMADDVEKVFPEAVWTTPDGYKAVAYSMIGIRMERANAV